MSCKSGNHIDNSSLKTLTFPGDWLHVLLSSCLALYLTFTSLWSLRSPFFCFVLLSALHFSLCLCLPLSIIFLHICIFPHQTHPVSLNYMLVWSFFCCDFGNLWLMGLCKKIIALMTSCLKFFLSALMPHVIRNGWVGKPLFRNYKKKSMQNNWKNEVQTAIKTMAEYTWLDPLLLHVFKFKWFNKHHILYSSLYCYLLGVLLA